MHKIDHFSGLFGNGKMRVSHAYIVQFLPLLKIAVMVLAELRASIDR